MIVNYQPPRSRIGIGTPQANPTVEPELRCLLPANVHMHTARLVGQNPDPRKKLVEYLENLPQTLATYDTLALDVFGYACTSSSYLTEPEYEARILDRASEVVGCPIVPCAQAIIGAVRFMGAESLAVVCPYPTWLMEASVSYWRKHEIEVFAAHTLNPDAEDTRSIYDLDPTAILDRTIDLLGGTPADLVLIAGTGLPTLNIISELSVSSGKPVLTSNICLAWRLLQEVGGENSLLNGDIVSVSAP